jgi:hypothetical protein
VSPTKLLCPSGTDWVDLVVSQADEQEVKRIRQACQCQASAFLDHADVRLLIDLLPALGKLLSKPQEKTTAAIAAAAAAEKSK